MLQRQEFVRQAQAEGANISALCRQSGISRKTGYKWLARYRTAGEGGLEDRSRRPHHSPGQTGAAVEAAVVQARQAHPAWGGRKLKAWLEQHGQTALPAPSTIRAILARQGMIEAAEAAKHRPTQRFERQAPNELWQMDFKGDFALGNGQRCHPLTVLDDHSRFLVGLRACGDETETTVQAELTALFRGYGLPDCLLTDNGSPWGNPAGASFTALRLWLLRLGVPLIHGRPYHPQTQGKDERLHRTLLAELLRRVTPRDQLHCQRLLDDWRLVYNLERPHEALDLRPPSSRYQPSPRPFPERLPPVEYPAGSLVRQVDSSGKIAFRGQPWRIGRPFAGYPVALRLDDRTDGLVHVFFCQICVTTLDMRQGER
jgi:transposase InsO family protein